MPRALGLSLGLAVAVALASLAFSGAADNAGERHLEQSLQRALLAFATARALNGVISVAQGTEVALEPAGVGVNFSPGEILDPVNDLIERFSWVMLLASSSIGVQQLLLQVGGWWPVSAALVLALGLAVAGAWRGWWREPVFRRVLSRVLLVALVVRFAVPAFALLNELLFVQFLAPQYSEASANLERTREQVDVLNQGLSAAPEPEQGLLDRLGSLASQMSDWREQLAQYQQAAEAATRSAVDLIVVFAFQAVLLPLGFLWLLVAGLRALLGGINRP